MLDIPLVTTGPSISNSVIVLSVATLFGALLGALTQVAWQGWKLRQERGNVRRAIWAELMTIRPYLEGHLGPEGQFLRNTIYKENAEKLGLLTSQEVEAIVALYGHLINVQEAVNQKAGETMDRNAVFMEGYMESDLPVWFNHAVEQLYPHVDIEDDLEDIKIPSTPEYPEADD